MITDTASMARSPALEQDVTELGKILQLFRDRCEWVLFAKIGSFAFLFRTWVAQYFVILCILSPYVLLYYAVLCYVVLLYIAC